MRWGNLTKCGRVTCDGLASRPGEVATRRILLAASCYRNRDKLRQLWASHTLYSDTDSEWIEWRLARLNKGKFQLPPPLTFSFLLHRIQLTRTRTPLGLGLPQQKRCLHCPGFRVGRHFWGPLYVTQDLSKLLQYNLPKVIPWKRYKLCQEN